MRHLGSSASSQVRAPMAIPPGAPLSDKRVGVTPRATRKVGWMWLVTWADVRVLALELRGW
jgi:hypothetical protein